MRKSNWIISPGVKNIFETTTWKKHVLIIFIEPKIKATVILFGRFFVLVGHTYSQPPQRTLVNYPRISRLKTTNPQRLFSRRCCRSSSALPPGWVRTGTSCLEEMWGNFPWKVQGHLEKIKVRQLVPLQPRSIVIFQFKIPGIF